MMYGVRRFGIVLPIAGLVLGLTVVFPTSAVGNEVVKWNETMLKAIVANGQSYAGIHFRSACEDGLALGRKVGERVAKLYLQPVRK